jgi:hypothetical protein
LLRRWLTAGVSIRRQITSSVAPEFGKGLGMPSAPEKLDAKAAALGKGGDDHEGPKALLGCAILAALILGVCWLTGTSPWEVLRKVYHGACRAMAEPFHSPSGSVSVPPKVWTRYRGTILHDNRFELRIWHQHTGRLRNGRLVVTASGKRLIGDGLTNKKLDAWSFEEWRPNEENARAFVYDLRDTVDGAKLRFVISLESEGTSFDRFEAAWSGYKWEPWRSQDK